MLGFWICVRFPYKFSILALALLATLAPGLTFANECSRVIRLGWPEDVVSLTPDSRVYNDLQIATDVLTRAGCAFDVRILPWPRLVRMIEAGQLDMLPLASRTPEREQFAAFSPPYRLITIGVAIRRADRDIFTLPDQDMSGFQLVFGRLSGHSLGKEVDDMLAETLQPSQVFIIDRIDTGLEMLNLNRIDGIISNKAWLVERVAVRELNESLMVYPDPLGYDRLTMMFSRASLTEQDIERLSAAVRPASIENAGALE